MRKRRGSIGNNHWIPVDAGFCELWQFDGAFAAVPGDLRRDCANQPT